MLIHCASFEGRQTYGGIPDNPREVERDTPACKGITGPWLSCIMQGLTFTLLTITGFSALTSATKNFFSLCRSTYTPLEYVSKSESFDLDISGSGWTGLDLSCSLKLTTFDSDDTIYYQFTKFSVVDSGISLEITHRSDSLYNDKVTYSKEESPDFAKTKAYSSMEIIVTRSSIFTNGISARLSINNKPGESSTWTGRSSVFYLPISSIIGITIGCISLICVPIGICIAVSRHRKRRSRGPVVTAGPTPGTYQYPTVATYNNQGAYPMHTFNQPAGYYTPGMAPAYQPPQGYQPQGVAASYPVTPGQPQKQPATEQPTSSPPSYESANPSAPTW